jgi:hypothetical protein
MRHDRHPHFLVEIEGISVHYQIAKSKDPDAVPLIFRCVCPALSSACYADATRAATAGLA